MAAQQPTSAMAAPSRMSSISQALIHSLSRVSSLSTTASRTTESAQNSTVRQHSPQPATSNGNAHAYASTSPSTIRAATAAQATMSRIEPANIPSPSAQARSGSSSRPRRPYGYWRDWWIWEVLACLVSMLSLLAICITLAVYDGHQYPNIDMGLTLNAVVALLTTIMKGAFLTLLAEGTSQLKWIAFVKNVNRPLNDFNVYDAASRGGFGSLWLLWRFRKEFWRHIVTLAAILYIISIAVDTFTQQLVQTKYANSDTNAHDVFLARTERYDGFYQKTNNRGKQMPDNLAADMTAAVWSGIYGGSSPTQGLFNCSSGNCTYPLTPSLAVCSQCNNLTSDLTYNLGTWLLPQHRYVDYDPMIYKGPYLGTSYAIMVMATDNASETNTFQDVGAMVASFAYINRTNLNGGDGKENIPAAWECALWMCVEVYSASVTSGVLTQEVVQVFDKVAPHAAINTTGGERDFDIITQPDLMPSPSVNHTFSISALALRAFHLKIPRIFPGSVLTTSYGTNNGPATQTFSDDSETDMMQHWFTMSDPRAMVSNLAAAMTSSIRRNPARSPDSNDTDSIPMYAGTAFKTVPRVHIVWQWITLPAALVLFSNLFILHTMYKTHGHRKRKSTGIGVWKSNQIPLLYHGLDQLSEERVTRELGPSPSISEMERHAKNLKARLREDGSGRLMLGT